MKRNILSLTTLLLTVVLFASCLGNDDDNNTTYYGDTAITSFSISTINADLTTTAHDGSDSIYSGTISVSAYRFYIDQVNGLIYNSDSLPSNVKVTAVLPSVGTKNSGVVVYKDDDSDSIFYYSTSQGIDFTNPREMTVYSQDGMSYRTYNVKVNVHKEKADSFAWGNTYANVDKLTTLTSMKAVSLNGKMFVFGNDGTEAKVYAASENNFAAWQEVTPNVALAVDAYKNVIVRNNVAYLLNEGKLLKSTDGENWTTVADANVKQLVGASSEKFYALTDDALVSSIDGSVWTAETIDGDVALPSKDVALFSEAARVNDNTNHLVLVGNPSESNAIDGFATVLGKVEENSENSPANSWFSYTDGKKKNLLPRLANLQVIRYGDMLLAFGGDGEGTCTNEAFDKFYQSVDGGISWQKSSVTVPKFTSSKTTFTIAADSKNYLWLICGESGQVWRGRLCKFTWTNSK